MTGEPRAHPLVRRSRPGFRWEDTELMAYKEAGSAPFKAISRQLLFKSGDLACELRYFEVAPGGYSTLERHEHVHAVMILGGHGRVLLGDRIVPVKAHDLVTIPPLTWHQFRPDGEAPLGFLCMVNVARDRPVLPDAAALATLRCDPAIASFIGLDDGISG